MLPTALCLGRYGIAWYCTIMFFMCQPSTSDTHPLLPCLPITSMPVCCILTIAGFSFVMLLLLESKLLDSVNLLESFILLVFLVRTLLQSCVVWIVDTVPLAAGGHTLPLIFLYIAMFMQNLLDKKCWYAPSHAVLWNCSLWRYHIVTHRVPTGPYDGLAGTLWAAIQDLNPE